MHSPDRHDDPGQELLQLARASIEHGAIHNEPLPIDCDVLPRSLAQPGATFTSLQLSGELRGCCGSLEAIHPLAVDTASSAFRAAYRDSRFNPVSRDEIASLRLEVSVLSPLEAMQVSSEADLLDQLDPAVDGLVIIAGPRRATFLPKVWATLPDPHRFLAELKAKCGLPADFWSDRLEFMRYRATTYAESD
jgi:AmmeMemoRadiSam system protein A